MALRKMVQKSSRANGKEKNIFHHGDGRATQVNSNLIRAA